MLRPRCDGSQHSLRRHTSRTGFPDHGTLMFLFTVRIVDPFEGYGGPTFTD